MVTYEFSIIASGLDHTAEDFEARFYDGGCSDALVSFQRGHIIVDFAREAASFNEAIASAVEAVRAVGAVVDRVEPDPLVSLSDIATRVDVSRAAVTQYASGQRRSGFPAPVAKVTSDCPLYHWHTVARWFFEHGRLSAEMVSQAYAVHEVNSALSCGELNVRTVLDRSSVKFVLPLVG